MNDIFVVVYGTLMTGERNARWANGAKRIPAKIRGELWDTGYGFPAFIPLQDGPEVVAELLVTNDEGLASMDRLEGFPRLYRRERIDVEYIDGGTKKAKAWVYVMNNLPRSASPIESGDWVNYRAGRVG